MDLDGNGIHTTSVANSQGTFDLLNNGTQVHSGWLSSGDGFLAVDHNGNGKIDSRGELFGGAIGDGFAKLDRYDSNHDGVVDAKDAHFKSLLVWQDLNGDHASSANELRSLAEAGIASMKVANTWDGSEQNGNLLGETSSATKADGSSIAMVDVYFKVGEEVPAATAVSNKLATLLEPADHLLHSAFGDGAATVGAAAHEVNLDGGETLRQMLAQWNAHTTNAVQPA